MKKRYAVAFSIKGGIFHISAIYMISPNLQYEDLVIGDNVVSVLIMNSERTKEDIVSQFASFQLSKNYQAGIGNVMKDEIEKMYLIGRKNGDFVTTKDGNQISLVGGNFKVEVVSW